MTTGTAILVLAFRTPQGSIPLAAFGAGVALALVVGVGALVHQPLSRVPENTMKFAVASMLATFGTIWSVEGVGMACPVGDVGLLGILVVLRLVSLSLSPCSAGCTHYQLWQAANTTGTEA
jgi:uncharacterized membrane protein